MRRWFAPLDDMLIEQLFQPLSDTLVNRLGLSRPHAACFCLDLAAISWILARTRDLSTAVVACDAGLLVVRTGVLMVGLLALLAMRMVFRRLGSGPNANPLRLSMRPHRLVVLLMLAARPLQFDWTALTDIADAGMLCFMASGLYLGACKEPPPLKRVLPTLLNGAAAD